MIKKLYLTLAAISIAASLTGCNGSNSTTRPTSHRFEVVSAEKLDGDFFEIYRDTQTGVEYLDFNGKSLVPMPKEDAQRALDLQTYEELKKKLGK